MVQVPLFAMDGDRIIRRIGHAVGLVVTDNEPLLADGDPGPAHLVPLALAKWAFGTLDRVDKARVH
jgi:hypothetical protein